MGWKNMDLKQKLTAIKLSQISGRQWGILLLVGILLVVLTLPVKEENKIWREAEGSFSDDSISVEKTELENRLESLLASTEGVGNVKVMLMTREKNADAFSGAKEIQVTGVLVVAKGGGNMVTVQNIKQAVMALFQLEAHKIKVMKMN